MSTSGTQRQINITVPWYSSTTSFLTIPVSNLPISNLSKLVRLNTSLVNGALGDYIYFTDFRAAASPRSLYSVPSGKTLNIIMIASKPGQSTFSGSPINLGYAAAPGATSYRSAAAPTTPKYCNINATTYLYIGYNPLRLNFQIPQNQYPFIRINDTNGMYAYILGFEE